MKYVKLNYYNKLSMHVLCACKTSSSTLQNITNKNHRRTHRVLRKQYIYISGLFLNIIGTEGKNLGPLYPR